MDDYRVTDDGGDRLRARAREGGARHHHTPAVTEQLRRLCAAATEELGLHGAVVSLMTETGDASAAGSGSHALALEELQFARGQGPSREAFDLGRPVLVPDLGDIDGRWPGFTDEALSAGVGGAYAFPLHLGALRFGVLACYSREARILTSPEISQLLIYAEVATDLLLDGTSPAAGRAVDGLMAALDVRPEVFQAQGMVAVDLAVDLAEALALMRATAFRDGIGLDRLAEEIIGGRLLRRMHDDPSPDGP